MENLKFLFLFHGLSFYLLEKNKKIRGHCTDYLSVGPNLTPSPQILRIIQYKTLRSDFLCHLYITYYLYEVTQHYNAKEKTKKTMYNRCPPGNQPWSSGSKVRHANHLATRSGRARLEITVHIGQIIWVSAIFVFANRVQ